MPKAVLIVDDDPRIRNLLAESLQTLGYETCVAGDGREAMENVRSGGIDCVISDIKMPELDGLTLLHQIKAEHRQ